MTNINQLMVFTEIIAGYGEHLMEIIHLVREIQSFIKSNAGGHYM